MKTDRNKNNVKSEENMILEKSRRSDANVFPVENKGKGKIAKAKKRQVKGVIWKTVLQQKWLSMGIVFAVAGAVVTALIPPLILAKIPVKNPWEVFAYLPFGGWNECPDTAELMAIARRK